MYKIELSNGNVIDKVKINGSLCSTTQAIDASTFAGGMNRIKITHTSNDEGDELCQIEPGEFERMKLEYVYADRWNKGTYIFLFTPLTDSDIEKMKLDARVAYLEMLSEEAEA